MEHVSVASLVRRRQVDQLVTACSQLDDDLSFSHHDASTLASELPLATNQTSAIITSHQNTKPAALVAVKRMLLT